METLDEFSWLVGFLEGEGSFGVYYEGKTPRIAVTSSDKDAIDRAARLMGAPSVRVARRAGYSEQLNCVAKELYIAVVQGVTALYLMLELLPHMSARRQEQIKHVIRIHAAYRKEHKPRGR